MKTLLFLTTLLFCANSLAYAEFILNGIPQPVIQDTGTPANSTGLPSVLLNTSGVAISPATDRTTAASPFSVRLSDGSAFYNGATETTLSTLNGKIPSNLTVTSTRLLVDGSGVTQPVSGTVTANQGGTWNINNVSGTVSLPTGASTEATLSTLNGKVPANLTVTSTRLLVDGSGVTQPISAAALPLPSGASTSAKQPALGTAGTASADVITVQGISSMTPLLSAQSGTWNITNVSGTVSLPTGASTETTLSAVNGKLPSTLGQKTAANSLAVVPASDYIPASPAVPATVTVKQAAVTIGTTAVRLTTDGSAPSATRRRLQVMLDPSSTANCYMGSSSVTSSSTTRGTVVFPGALAEFLDDANEYYAICDAASQTFFIVEAE